MRSCGRACACVLRREWILSEDDRGQCESGEGGEVREGSGKWLWERAGAHCVNVV